MFSLGEVRAGRQGIGKEGGGAWQAREIAGCRMEWGRAANEDGGARGMDWGRENLGGLEFSGARGAEALCGRVPEGKAL